MTNSKHNSKDMTLESAGVTGLITCPIIVGGDPVKAFEQLYYTVDKIKIPNVQYRTDVDKSALTKLKDLKRQGWL